jgi:hypothetical protein
MPADERLALIKRITGLPRQVGSKKYLASIRFVADLVPFIAKY